MKRKLTERELRKEKDSEEEISETRNPSHDRRGQAFYSDYSLQFVTSAGLIASVPSSFLDLMPVSF